MAKDPAFLFYSNDFYMATAYWTDQQVGKYIRLMILQHQHGAIEPEILESVSGGDPKILAKFITDEKGNFYNEVLRSHILKRKAHADKQKKNAALRWGKNAKSMPDECQPICQTDAKSMPLENEIDNEEDYLNEDKIFIRPDGENSQPTIIGDMSVLWMETFPKYQLMPAVDFKPLREIGEYICQAKRIDFDVGSLKCREIIKIEFTKIVYFISKDSFYNRLSLTMLATPKNYQSVIHAMNNKKDGTKNFNSNSGNKKQQQDDTLNDLISKTKQDIADAYTGVGRDNSG